MFKRFRSLNESKMFLLALTKINSRFLGSIAFKLRIED